MRTFLNEAGNEYIDNEFGKVPPLDMSFMGKEKKREKKNRPLYRWVSIAAAIVIIIGGSAVFQMANSQSEAYGNWGIIHRLIETISGGIATDEEEITDTPVDTIIIENESRIEEGKRVFEYLYIPEYIPEEFDFKSLTIDNYGTGTGFSGYTYIKEDSETLISIEQMYVSSGNVKYSSNNNGELIEFEDKLIYVVDGEQSVEVYTDNGMIVISGDISQDEKVKIAKNLEL